MATRKQTKKGATAQVSNGAGQVQMPNGGANAMPAGHPNVTVVESRQAFEREAQRLRANGFIEVPNVFGTNGTGGIQADYGEYITAKLACEDTSGKGKRMMPLLHVSSGYAQPVKAVNGHEGNMITWGWGNRIPNVVSLFCSLLPYTAAALKFNIDLCTGMGPRPMYAYTQYIGSNVTEKTIKYEDAGTLLRGMIRDLQLQLVKLEAEHPELTEDDAVGFSPEVRGSQRGSEQGAASEAVQTTPTPPNSGGENNTPTAPKKSAAEQMRDDINEQIEGLRKDLAIWEQTNTEVQAFLQNNNLLQTFQQLYSDMLQYNICFPEFELQQTYLVDSGRKDEKGKPIMQSVPASMWAPKVVGLKWRNAKTMRLEQMSNENKIEHVYISNQWLSSPEQTVPTKDGDFKIDALPALTYQSPATDLERLARDARTSHARKDARPTHVVMPVVYNEYGHPYYPIPAWYSIFSGDVYTYASLLIADRKKRRDNANVIGRILYLNDTYMQRLYMQRGCDTDDKKKALFKEVIDSINSFLKNRDNMGEPLLAYTFTDADGKIYKSWEIVEVQENNASQAEANKEELAEISSIILFTWGVDSTLIGNTPGTTVRSGGTDLRERYLLKQINMSTMQSLVMNTLNVVNIRNQWDPHLTWQIKKEVLTTLDNSKTGITSAEES